MGRAGPHSPAGVGKRSEERGLEDANPLRGRPLTEGGGTEGCRPEGMGLEGVGACVWGKRPEFSVWMKPWVEGG